MKTVRLQIRLEEILEYFSIFGSDAIIDYVEGRQDRLDALNTSCLELEKVFQIVHDPDEII